jgi:hypothetical protein
VNCAFGVMSRPRTPQASHHRHRVPTGWKPSPPQCTQRRHSTEPV